MATLCPGPGPLRLHLLCASNQFQITVDPLRPVLSSPRLAVVTTVVQKSSRLGDVFSAIYRKRGHPENTVRTNDSWIGISVGG